MLRGAGHADASVVMFQPICDAPEMHGPLAGSAFNQVLLERSAHVRLDLPCRVRLDVYDKGTALQALRVRLASDRLAIAPEQDEHVSPSLARPARGSRA